MKLRDFTSKLSWHQLYQIFEDFEQFEKDGVIGDCLLRETAEKIQFTITKRHDNVVLWMNLVANDCYRIVAERAMDNGFYYYNKNSFEYIQRRKK